MWSRNLPVEQGKNNCVKQVLKALSDGVWHRFDDLEKESEAELETVLRVANLFRDYGFVEISVGGEAAKLDKDYLSLETD